MDKDCFYSVLKDFTIRSSELVVRRPRSPACKQPKANNPSFIPCWHVFRLLDGFQNIHMLFSDKDLPSLAHQHKSTLLNKLEPQVDISFQRELYLRVCFIEQELHLTPGCS